MSWLVIYDRETRQVEHYISCSSKMPTLDDFGASLKPTWNTVELIDPPWEISRDHKLLFSDGEVVGTEPSLNPVQPVEEPIFPMSTHWARVEAMNPGAGRPLTVRRVYEGHEFTFDCYVSEQLVKLFQAGEIAIGDFVVVDFIEKDPDKPLATMKVRRTW